MIDNLKARERQRKKIVESITTNTNELKVNTIDKQYSDKTIEIKLFLNLLQHPS